MERDGLYLRAPDVAPRHLALRGLPSSTHGVGRGVALKDEVSPLAVDGKDAGNFLRAQPGADSRAVTPRRAVSGELATRRLSQALQKGHQVALLSGGQGFGRSGITIRVRLLLPR